jgi:hypothetical protein
MKIALGFRYRLNIELYRQDWLDHYTPVLLEQGYLKKLPTIPYYTYQRDRNARNDIEVAQLIIDKLKAEKLYNGHLLFAGFRGIYLNKNGSYGKRARTFAVTEKAFYRSVSEKWLYRHYINSPFLHMDVAGKSMPAIGVFDATKLVGGPDFGERSKRLPEYDKIAWWTEDGTSIDKAAVAVFFFKQYDSFDERFPTLENDNSPQ